MFIYYDEMILSVLSVLVNFYNYYGFTFYCVSSSGKEEDEGYSSVKKRFLRVINVNDDDNCY